MDPRGAARPRAQAASRRQSDIQTTTGRDLFRQSKPDPNKVPKAYPKPKLPVFHVQRGPKSAAFARKPPSYPGAPPSSPVPRPKPTCSGIDEALEAAHKDAFLHWAPEEGLHVHAGPPKPDQMEGGELLLQKDHPSDQWSTAGCKVKPHCGEARHCIPVFKFAPKLCPKSESIIRVYRQQRVKELWKKIDIEGEHIADLFALRPIAPSLDLSERRFLQAVIPSLVQQAVSKTSQDAARDPYSLGPKYDSELRLHALNPETEGPVKIGTLSPLSRPPRFAQEDGDVRETADEQQQEQQQEEERAAQLYRRLAREQGRVVMLDGDQATANASATPHLFVPESSFLATCIELLAHAFGVEGIDQFRDTISYSCRKLVEAVSPEAARKIAKPYVLAFSRKLDLERQQQQQQQMLQEQQQHQRLRSRSVPPCGDPGCCIEEQQQIMSRRWTRFDAVIQRYVRKRQQQEHVAQALQDLRDGELCTFHPELNPTPRYLKKGHPLRGPHDLSKRQQQMQQQQQEGLLPTDPMVILKQFCSRYVADERCSELVKSLEECSFQPNAKKYLKQERDRQQQQQQQLQQQQQSKGKVPQPGECCGDEEGATAAAVDAIFGMLDSPFDAIFKADIRQWLQQEDQDEKEAAAAARGDPIHARLLLQAKLAAAAPKKWILDGREPQHRERRQRLRMSDCVLNAEGQPVIALNTTAAATAAAAAAARGLQGSSSTGRIPGTPRIVAASSRITNPTER